MSKKVNDIPLYKWSNLEVYQFRNLIIGLSRFQKDSLAKSLRELHGALS